MRDKAKTANIFIHLAIGFIIYSRYSENWLSICALIGYTSIASYMHGFFLAKDLFSRKEFRE